MRLMLIDNYDSFTWNLVDYFRTLGASVDVRRNDQVGVGQALEAEAVVISPGPGRPEGAGVSLDIVGACAEIGKPLLGVCLGHQAIAEAFGGRTVRGPAPVHGKVATIMHDGRGLFEGCAARFAAARYHSLVTAGDGFPAVLEIAAETVDGSIMGIRHRGLPIHGVQFHPESIASAEGHRLLGNFLRLAAGSKAS